MPATNEGQNTSKRNDQTTTLVIQPHHHSSASTVADSAASTPSARHCSNTSSFNPGPSYPGPCYTPVPTLGPLNNSAASYSPEIITVSDSEPEPDASSELELPTTTRVYCQQESQIQERQIQERQIEEYFVINGTSEQNVFATWERRYFPLANDQLPEKLGLDDAKLRYEKICELEFLLEISGVSIEQAKEEKQAYEKNKKKRHQSPSTEADDGEGALLRRRLALLRSAATYDKEQFKYASDSLELDRVSMKFEATVQFVTNYALSWGIVPNTTSSESRTYSWISTPKAKHLLSRRRAEATNAYIRKTTTEFEQRMGRLSEVLLGLKRKAKALAGKSCKDEEEGFKKSQTVAQFFLDALVSGDTQKLEEADKKASDTINTLPDATGQESVGQILYQQKHLQCVEQLCIDCNLLDTEFSPANFLRRLKAEMPSAPTPGDGRNRNSELELPTTPKFSQPSYKKRTKKVKYLIPKGSRDTNPFSLKNEKIYTNKTGAALRLKLGRDDARRRYRAKDKYSESLKEKEIKTKKMKETVGRGVVYETGYVNLTSSSIMQRKRLDLASNLLELNRRYLELKDKIEAYKRAASKVNISVDESPSSPEERTFRINYRDFSHRKHSSERVGRSEDKTAALSEYAKERCPEFECNSALLSEFSLQLKLAYELLVRKSYTKPEEGLQTSQTVAKIFLNALASGDRKKLQEAKKEVSDIINALTDATDQESENETCQLYFQCFKQLHDDCNQAEAEFSQEAFLSSLKAEKEKEEEEARSETTAASTSAQLGKHLASRGLFRQPPLTKARRIETETVTSNQALPIDLSCGYRSST